MMTITAVRTALIAAHRAKDWERAAMLSQAKERLKRRSRQCGCGVTISWKAERCFPCAIRFRNKRRIGNA